ncbi:allophanate hydrolase subunit 1 [Paenarthrobacter sp. NPDC090522]|uniref:5-oxoprolinase subunit B family protein n=1 Tax=Paenarthrobacter sp. NPDC090522 TaxID=3364383 RepID=UPI00382F9210
MKTRLVPSGEAAFRLLVEDATFEEQWEAVHKIASWVANNPLPGVYGTVPTYDSLLVEFDPELQSFLTLSAGFESLVQQALATPGAAARRPRHFTLPVVYGGEHGPDLGFVAGHLGISEKEVVALHTARDHVVRCLGGPAASCMIDGPAFTRPIPRLPDPRLEVPANAVSVAGKQGVVGPVRAPSGWRLIGLSPVSVLDWASPTLVPYRPGDTIRFRAIEAAEWDDYSGLRLSGMAL